MLSSIQRWGGSQRRPEASREQRETPEEIAWWAWGQGNAPQVRWGEVLLVLVLFLLCSCSVLVLFLLYSCLALFCFGAWIAHFIHCEGSQRLRHNPTVKKDYKPRRLSYHGVGEGTFLWLDEYFLRAGSNMWEQKVLWRIESPSHFQKLLNLCLLWRVSRQKCSCGLLEI